MKRLLFFLSILLLPIVLMVWVNAVGGSPSHERQEQRCTRYCHDKGCVHHKRQLDSESSNWTLFLHELYQQNIQLLKHNPFGLGYAEMNILIYVILFPLIISLLSWGLIRKRK